MKKMIRVMLCIVMVAILFAVGASTSVGADDPVTIYVDTFWIDQRDDLTPEQRQQLKDCIIHDIQRNFDLAVGAGKVEVTNDPTKEAGSDRQVLIRRGVGTHTNPDGTTGYHYGQWIGGDTAGTVYLGSFMDLTAGAQDPDDYKTDGQWDITKLNNAIGQTCAHELGHSFCIGHNGETKPEDQSKMTDGGLVGSLVKANNAWMFDEHSERVLAENLNKKSCKSAVDYDEMALTAYFWGGPDLPGVPDEWGAIDALFSFSGPLASEFELGWYGVDTDKGVIDGSSEFDFIYKTSMLADPEQNAEMLTFFEGITDKVQFLLRGAPGSPWEGEWFLLDDENVVLEDFVETPDGDYVARLVVMEWDVDGMPSIDVQVTLDANAFGEYSNPYNGFTYEYVSPPVELPTITSITPDHGNQGETLDVVITGTNFAGATEVSFGAEITVNIFNVDSSTQITANIAIDTDAPTGPRGVSVTTPGGTAILVDGFTIVSVTICELNISSTAGGSVTAPGEGTFTYDFDTWVDLVATPDAGYRFVEWTGDVDTIADVNDATTTITMNGDYTITANFEGGCGMASAADLGALGLVSVGLLAVWARKRRGRGPEYT